MAKMALVERIPGDRLKLVESDPNKLPAGVLCTLEGPFGETEKETENGRAYSNKLWNRVLASDDFQSRKASLNLLGEADHPEGLETSITRVSHVITDEWLNEDENTLFGRLDVLDTPSGRIIKTLVDYGWKPGISSRGAGEIVSSVGMQQINADTYEYIVHDLVVDPACQSAHLNAVSESKGRGKVTLTEALTRLAEEDKDEYEKSWNHDYYTDLFEKKFGIKLEDKSSVVAYVSEKEPSVESEDVMFLRKRIASLGVAVTELSKQLSKEDQSSVNEDVDEAVKALVQAYADNRTIHDEAVENMMRLEEEMTTTESELRNELDTIKTGTQRRIDQLTQRAASKAAHLCETRKKLVTANATLVGLRESTTEELGTKDTKIEELETQLSELMTSLQEKVDDLKRLEAKARASRATSIASARSKGSGTGDKSGIAPLEEMKDRSLKKERPIVHKKSGAVPVSVQQFNERRKPSSPSSVVIEEEKKIDRIASIVAKTGSK